MNFSAQRAIAAGRCSSDRDLETERLALADQPILLGWPDSGSLAKIADSCYIRSLSLYATSVRLVALSFFMMLRMWTLTVLSHRLSS